MTLQKGRLGLGTTEPQGRLAVLDEPHNLEEFPPRPMTGYKNYFEGHGEFCASASSTYSGYYPWQVFEKLTNVVDSNWHGATSVYDSSGNFTGSYILGGYSGEYIILEIPYKVTLSSIGLHPRVITNILRMVSDGELLGSNDGVIWESIYSFSGLTWPTSTWQYLNFTNSKNYTYIALVVTKLAGNGGFVNIGEIKFFGTREQGQSVLHDGQLTLTKSLNVPRIGPPLDADDTPRRDRLVVEYNTSTNPTFEGAVRDTSGRGLDGALFGGAYYDANEKALKFDGTDDYIFTGNIGNHAGAWIHSYSVWINLNDYTNENIVLIGQDASGNKASSLKVNNSTAIHWFFFGNDVTFTHSMTLGSWYHIAAVYDGGAPDSSRRMWINGTELTVSLAGAGTALNLSANAEMRIGRRQAYEDHFNGEMSQFKLYDTTLTAEEVKTLYDMGRKGNVANPQPLHIAAPLYSPGTIVQVESSTKTDVTTISSTTAANIAGLSVNITPKFGTSKVLVSYHLNIGGQGHGFVKIQRTQSGVSSYIGLGDVSGDLVATTSYFYSDNELNDRKGIKNISFEFLDSANGIGAITYDIMCWKKAANYVMHINKADNEDSATYYGRTSSSITVKEVCQ